MASNQRDYGHLTVPSLEGGFREIKITNYIQSDFKDNRKVSVFELEDDSMFIQIDNGHETGRNIENKLWLTKDSFLSTIVMSILYLQSSGVDIEQTINDIVGSDEIEFIGSLGLFGKTEEE